MGVITVLLAAYAAATAGYWLRTAYGVARLRSTPRLNEGDGVQGERLPRLSVVVPACDEVDKLEPAFRTLMAQDDPELELILVDDRSTDGTGELADRLASEDSRVKVIHVRELPEGWLGKVHALQRGHAESRGEFVLFTDADVHFGPRALRKVVRHCQRHGLDHLAAIPHLRPAGPLTDAVVSAFLRPFMTLLARPWKVPDPRSGAFMGVGAFNMVRRAAFERTEGFEWLRMEVGDDMGLGLLMKRSGARCGVVSAFDDVWLTWHRSVREAIQGSEKAYAPVCQFSIWRGVMAGSGIVAVELAPIVLTTGLLGHGTRIFGVVGVALIAVEVASTAAVARWARGHVLPAILSPLASIIGAYALVRAAVLGKLRGGVAWRGTVYPSEMLKRGMRLKLGLTGSVTEQMREN